jgi:hypothetical protein
MKYKIILTVVVTCFLFQACNKSAAPATIYNMKYNVVISNKIKEPSVVAGFFGHMTKAHKKSSTPKPSSTPILIFPFAEKEQIESVRYEEKGKIFYNLKKLAAQGIKAKYRFVPNSSGFYQMDLGEEQFCILIAASSKKGFYPGGVGVLNASMTELVELNLSGDY